MDIFVESTSEDGKKRKSTTNVNDLAADAEARAETKKAAEPPSASTNAAQEHVVKIDGDHQTVHIHLHVKRDSDVKLPVRIELAGAVAGNVLLDQESNKPVTTAVGRATSSAVNYGNSTVVFQNGQMIQFTGADVSVGGTSSSGVHLTIEGSVGGLVKTVSGSVYCKDGIQGDVQTSSGDIRCGGNVSGKAESMSGDITVGGSVCRNVSTMSGDVTIKGTANGQVSSMSGSVKRR